MSENRDVCPMLGREGLVFGRGPRVVAGLRLSLKLLLRFGWDTAFDFSVQGT
jgi:hypothetical protein